MTEWMQKGLCKGKNIDYWVPPIDIPNASQYFGIARAVCEQCKVWEYCLDEGMKERWGMWGGLTPNERRFITDGGSFARAHGTVARYRQGCTCKVCEDAASTPVPPINLSFIPNTGEPLPDIDELKDRLSGATD